MRSLSALLVDNLRGQGKTLREIGEHIGVSESFMSRVANGENNLTIDHLVALERALRRPLPLLLLDACRQNGVPAGLRDHYERLVAVLSESGEMSEPDTNGHDTASKLLTRRSR